MPPRATTQRKTGTERRREILAAMLAMAADEGAEQVTTRALARRVGISEPALYRHFPGGKAEMWRALASFVGEHMQDAWRRALAHAQGAPAQLRALVTAQLGLMQSLPALPVILFTRALHRDNAALRAAMAEVAGRFHARLEQIVSAGQRRGELRRDVDPDTTAWLLISMMQGTTMRWWLNERSFDLGREGARLFETALTGLLVPADAPGASGTDGGPAGGGPAPGQG
ncbi:MAG TPA: TetR family transcriptional regulator [Thermohalobaculum sp.]|nr:TetR family transcriptional regulator [Thermohalobaculum sp.]